MGKRAVKPILMFKDMYVVNSQQGKKEYALSFDGVNDYVELTNSISLDSVSMWIDLSSIIATKYFLGNMTLQEGLRYNGITLLLLSGTFQELPYTPASNWVHLVLVKQPFSSTYNIYENTIFLGSITPGSAPQINCIGARWNNTISALDFFFNGKIYDLAFYSGALSQSEIEALYVFENINRVATARFDWSNTGSILKDQSAFENDGTIYGATWVEM